MFTGWPDVADDPKVDLRGGYPGRAQIQVSGAFQAVNYGPRPVGALLGGVLGTLIGLRPALWVATAGGALAFLVLLPSPLPGFQMPPGDG
jgi:hypothetical protein